MAAADKNDTFLIKRPPRAVSFMRWLGSLTAKTARPEIETLLQAPDQPQASGGLN